MRNVIAIHFVRASRKRVAYCIHATLVYGRTVCERLLQAREHGSRARDTDPSLMLLRCILRKCRRTLRRCGLRRRACGCAADIESAYVERHVSSPGLVVANIDAAALRLEASEP